MLWTLRKTAKHNVIALDRRALKCSTLIKCMAPFPRVTNLGLLFHQDLELQRQKHSSSPLFPSSFFENSHCMCKTICSEESLFWRLQEEATVGISAFFLWPLCPRRWCLRLHWHFLLVQGGRDALSHRALLRPQLQGSCLHFKGYEQPVSFQRCVSQIQKLSWGLQKEFSLSEAYPRPFLGSISLWKLFFKKSFFLIRAKRDIFLCPPSRTSWLKLKYFNN